MKNTLSLRLSATVFQKHKYISNPYVTPSDRIIAAAGALAKLLTGNLPQSLNETSLTHLEPRRSRWVREVSLRDCGKLPVRNVASAPAAAMMRLAGVTSGLEMYLCLWNTVADTRKERVFVIHIVQAR